MMNRAPPNPNAPEDSGALRQRIPANAVTLYQPLDDAKDNANSNKRPSGGSSSIPPQGLIVKQDTRAMSKGPQKQKTIKLVYKQMRESSEKGKGGHIFQSMEESMNHWVANDAHQFNVSKAEDLCQHSDESVIHPRTDRVYEF